MSMGIAVFPMEPEPMAAQLREMVEEFEVGIIGGCCGTTRSTSSNVDRDQDAAEPVRHRPSGAPAGQVASMIRAVDLQQEPAPLIVGERVNTQGSRKVKRSLLADDLTVMLTVARDQMEEGAHTLDVCMALTERPDERDIMRKLVKKLRSGGRRSARHRLDRSRRHQGRARAEPGPRYHQLDQYGKRSRHIEAVLPHVDGAWRRRHRPHHR